MKSKSTVFGAASPAAGVLHFGARAAVHENRVTLSGDGFALGPTRRPPNGLEVGDTYVFQDFGGFSDGLTYEDQGALLFSGPPSNPTFLSGVVLEDKADSGKIDWIEAAWIADLRNWAPMLAGFAGRAMAGYGHKARTDLPR